MSHVSIDPASNHKQSFSDMKNDYEYNITEAAEIASIRHRAIHESYAHICVSTLK